MSSRKRPPRGARMVGYLVAIAVSAVLWYVAHNVLRWRLPFVWLTQSFVDVLPALRSSLGATIVANALFVVYDPPWFKGVAQVVLNALALHAAYMLYRVLPFRFELEPLGWLLRLGLIGVMIALAVATVVQMIRAPFGRE